MKSVYSAVRTGALNKAVCGSSLRVNYNVICAASAFDSLFQRFPTFFHLWTPWQPNSINYSYCYFKPICCSRLTLLTYVSFSAIVQFFFTYPLMSWFVPLGVRVPHVVNHCLFKQSEVLTGQHFCSTRSHNLGLFYAPTRHSAAALSTSRKRQARDL
jgi:hypothetical protein